MMTRGGHWTFKSDHGGRTGLTKARRNRDGEADAAQLREKGPQSLAAERLEVEEHRLAVALKADVETVDRRTLLPIVIAVFALRDQGRTARFPLDQVDHRVGRVRLRFIAEIQPRAQPEVDAAPDDPDVDVRRHRPAVAADHRARLDRVEG